MTQITSSTTTDFLRIPVPENMEMHQLGYIAYAMGLHLAKYDENFDFDSIDEEWDDRVYSWIMEFYTSKRFQENTHNESFIECLNAFMNYKLEGGQYYEEEEKLI